MTIRIGTRGSHLALWQAQHLQSLLIEQGSSAELRVIRTTGDKRHDLSLATIGGKGLFIKELEEALERDEIDVAVHSLKDVPSIIPDHFELAGFLERADPRDAWLHPHGATLSELVPGAVVGTSSPRRRAQLRSRYPHLVVEDIRGNVDSRIEKTRSGDYNGVVLAKAGLQRLGRADEITSLFSVDDMVPAAGQGIVAIEILGTRLDLKPLLAAITHAASAAAARIERGVLQRFGTLLDCYSSIAVHAVVTTSTIAVKAFASQLDGSSAIRTSAEFPATSERSVIDHVFSKLELEGAMEIFSAGSHGR